MAAVRLDLNSPEFQDDLFSLQAPEILAVISMLRRLSQLEWNQVYRDRGLRWEAITSRTGPKGHRLYSLRVTVKMRAVGYREGDYLRLLSLHPDHDSAYE